MSAINATIHTQLVGFLLWNAINHFKSITSFQRFHSYWLSARDRYDMETLLGKYLRTTNATGIFGMVIISVLAIFLIAALTAPVANLTTGITIAHTGFTPNPNVTQTPGLTPILQIYPLFFVFIGLIFLAKHFGEESRGL